MSIKYSNLPFYVIRKADGSVGAPVRDTQEITFYLHTLRPCSGSSM